MDGKAKRMVRQLYCFDKPVRGMARNPQRGGYLFQSLVMKAVHSDDWLTVDLGDMGTFFDLDFMNKSGPPITGIIVIERIRKLVRDVGV